LIVPPVATLGGAVALLSVGGAVDPPVVLLHAATTSVMTAQSANPRIPWLRIMPPPTPIAGRCHD